MGSRLERSIEKAFVNWCKARGLKQRKLQDLGREGYPDRTVYLGNGRTCCVELKKVGGRASPSQERTAQELCNLGIPVIISDKLKSVTLWIERLLSGDPMNTSKPLKDLSSTGQSGRGRKGAGLSSSTRGSGKRPSA